MDEHCILCPTSTYGSRNMEDRYEIFPRPCSTCTSWSTDKDDVCDICEHLRLPHLLNCISPGIRSQYEFTLNREVLESCTIKCRFCSILRDQVMAYWESLAGMGLHDRPISSLILTFREPQEMSSMVLATAESPSVALTSGLIDIKACWNTAKENESLTSLASSEVHIGIIRIDEIRDPPRPLTGKHVSWPWLKTKMMECQETHYQCWQEGNDSLPEGFRVIDVIKRCIVQRKDVAYLALSYVWGKNPTSHLTAYESTIEEMMKENGLPQSEIPRTIEDAMTATLRIGHRYLWVDRLCIIQDNERDKDNQIEGMGSIYSSARLVLIAMHGDSSESGLPGIGPPRNTVQRSHAVLGLAVTGIMDSHSARNTWSNRAWTYQEAVLSKRRLYFTASQVFFECRQLLCFEDRFNVKECSPENPHLLTSPKDESRFGSYNRHVSEYSKRKLTNRSDVYLALLGILRALYNGPNAFVYGLPRLDFDRALLWNIQLRNPKKHTETQGVVLPSWSWASRACAGSAFLRRTPQMFYGALASIFLSDELDSGYPIAALNISPDIKVDENWQFYITIAVGLGCFDYNSRRPRIIADSPSNAQEPQDLYPKDYYLFCEEALFHSVELKFCSQIKPGVILIICQRAFFRLYDPPFSHPMMAPLITDSEDNIVGSLSDASSELRTRLQSAEYDDSTDYEFIALSLSGREPKNKEQNIKMAPDVSLCHIPIVNVMMIARDGRYAQRQEIGHIDLVHWHRSSRHWGQIFLG